MRGADHRICWHCRRQAERTARRDLPPASQLLAELVDAWSAVERSLISGDDYDLFTPERRELIRQAGVASDRARVLLGRPWPLDCVRPETPTTTQSQA